MTDAALAALSDRADILSVVSALAHAQDDRDWDRLRGLFADRVQLDMTTVFGSPAIEVEADALLDMARSTLDGFSATHHSTSNVDVTVDGDAADCRAHVIAYHHVTMDPGVTDFCTMRGYWKLALRRAGGRWVIHRWTIVRAAPWEGDPGLYEVAASRAKRR